MKTIEEIYTKHSKVELAERWFSMHNIPTVVLNESILVPIDGFEFELSEFEISYRADEYVRLYLKEINK